MANEGIIKKTTGEITAKQGKPKTLNDYIKLMEPEIKKALRTAQRAAPFR